MLPYLEKLRDFNFISKDNEPLLNLYFESLIQHIKDISGDIGIGFMLFGLKYNPSLLADIISFGENKSTL